MKEKYFVIGFRKIHDDAEYKNKIVGHNHRNRHYIKNHKNIDWSKTDKNIILNELKFKSEKEIREYAKEHLAKGKRQLQKNKAFAFEIVVDCTPRSDWNEQDYINYLKDAYNFLKERFKGQTIASAVIHRDESKPHLHITFLYFNEELGKWNQKDLMKEKKTDLNRLLDDFEKAVGQKYGFIRGKGKELDKPLKKALSKAVEEKVVLEKKLGFIPIPKKEKVIDTKKAVKQIKKLNNKVKRLIREAEYYKDIENKYKEIERKNLMLSREKEELEKRLKDLEQKALELKKENEKLRKENKELKQKNIVLVDNYKKALEVAAREIHMRTSRDKKVNEKMLDVTIDKIKKDYSLSI